MKPANALAAILLLTQALAGFPAHAGLTGAQRQEPDEVSEVDPAITKKLQELDDKAAAQENARKMWDERIDTLTDTLDTKTSIRDNMSGSTRIGRRVINRFECSTMENYSTGCQDPRSYGHEICSNLRYCRQWYKSNRVDDATLKSLRKQVSDLEVMRDSAENMRDFYKDQRKALFKTEGGELRDPRDLSELRGEQKMQFKEALVLNPNQGTGFKQFDDCTFTVTPLSSSEGGFGPWLTGGAADKTSWKIVYMNAEPINVTETKGCANRLSVHSWRERECRVSVQMDGHYEIPVSVVLENDNGKFLNVEGTGDGKGKKEVLACLTKRGFSPAKIFAKSKPVESEVANVPGTPAKVSTPSVAPVNTSQNIDITR